MIAAFSREILETENYLELCRKLQIRDESILGLPLGNYSKKMIPKLMDQWRLGKAESRISFTNETKQVNLRYQEYYLNFKIFFSVFYSYKTEILSSF